MKGEIVSAMQEIIGLFHIKEKTNKPKNGKMALNYHRWCG